LEKIDSTGVTWEEIRRNENRYSRHQLRKGFNPITWVMALWQRRQTLQIAERKHNRVIAHERLMTAELALRCYQSEQGRLPSSLEQLVPEYLQQVPLDPFSGRPVIYHPQGTNWLLYSVGEDGVDDGGKRVGRSVSGTVTKGDLFYDSPY
jgi:UDP:flavonoid glycosyltransferase YjiC (YdhE family)